MRKTGPFLLACWGEERSHPKFLVLQYAYPRKPPVREPFYGTPWGKRELISLSAAKCRLPPPYFARVSSMAVWRRLLGGLAKAARLEAAAAAALTAAVAAAAAAAAPVAVRHPYCVTVATEAADVLLVAVALAAVWQARFVSSWLMRSSIRYCATLIALGCPVMVTIRLRVPGAKIPFFEI
uniref:Uncharacterized protein n=1 Tax=Anopheles farauti TaxID=69004 RepID=A0A182QWY2_9DIPT